MSMQRRRYLPCFGAASRLDATAPIVKIKEWMAPVGLTLPDFRRTLYPPCRPGLVQPWQRFKRLYWNFGPWQKTKGRGWPGCGWGSALPGLKHKTVFTSP